MIKGNICTLHSHESHPPWDFLSIIFHVTIFTARKLLACSENSLDFSNHSKNSLLIIKSLVLKFSKLILKMNRTSNSKTALIKNITFGRSLT